ncbi:DHA2 family multidrug resistance protein-like MFS transporter [Actinoalloteichus hoggarensis]|uniref:Antiseptic resistance protein n=1 Tax=Actinoalloteichus hoggarensis TaxID=1470176 RepID=A0A221W4Z2_9PSEU|nr:MFS transporter [Actinoalloteichus hoggarensis]ASO20607.1 Antiseptic resistance protein [Actinoalloteichus hoggarensis]MBB5923648.1 DHA2 family multidrug resistance protein-like MFS transporter [Actinoalloteichus hoggarensis]
MTTPRTPDAPGSTAGHLSTGRRWAALAVLAASLLAVVMDMTILNVALPEIAATLSPTAAQQLWIVDVYSLVLAGLLVTMSTLGDRWGRKRMLLTGFAVFGAGSLLIMAAETAPLVIAVRALLGVGGAMIMPATLSMIRSLFTDPGERARALGVWAAVASLGAAIGPIVGGLLLEHFSWRAAFLVNVPWMAAAIIVSLFLLPEARDPAPGRWDAGATVLSIAGMVALIWGIKRVAKEGPADVLAVAALAAGLALLGWFVVRCLRSDSPLLRVRLFAVPSFTAGTVAALFTMLAMGSALLLIAQWFQLVEGASPLQAGIGLLPMAVASAVVSPLAPWLAQRIGARTVLIGGLAASGLGFAVLALAPTPLTSAPVTVALILAGAGMGSLAIASAIIMSGTPVEHAGSAAAIEETSYELGAVLGVAVLGSASAALYRNALPAEDLLAAGLAPETVGTAQESLGGALHVLAGLGPAGASAADQARDAFTHGLTLVGAMGAAIMLVSVIVVFALTPRGLDVTKGH